MTKTAQDRLNEAVNIIEGLQKDGYVVNGYRRMSLSATAAVKAPAETAKPPGRSFGSGVLKNVAVKDEVRS